MTPEDLAELFHTTYERLAPVYSYETRKASAVPWKDVPDMNKRLMIATAGEVLRVLQQRQDGSQPQPAGGAQHDCG